MLQSSNLNLTVDSEQESTTVPRDKLMSCFRVFLVALAFFFLPYAHAEALLKDHQGHETPFSSLKGKWVFINYWASWCPSCLEEIPEFNRFYKHHQSEAIALYAVNFDGLPLAQQIRLTQRFKIRYPSLAHDPAGALDLGDIPGIPVTFVFNPEGTLETTLYGAQTEKALNKIIASR